MTKHKPPHTKPKNAFLLLRRHPGSTRTESSAASDVYKRQMYGSQQSIFLEWAKNNGAAQISDGLGMLVEQAAESFYVWRGVRPETRAVISMLKKQISLL